MIYPARPRQSARIVTTNVEEPAEAEVADRAPVKVRRTELQVATQTKHWTSRPHETSVEKFQRKLKKLCKRSWSISMSVRIAKLNSLTRGWINYFSIGAMKVKMEKIDEHLRAMLRKVIWKQWKTPSKRAWELRKLGINNDLAKLTSYCGNRYEWVVRKTCVVWAISKEILARRGLVSCLDYYMIRHSLKTN